MKKEIASFQIENKELLRYLSNAFSPDIKKFLLQADSVEFLQGENNTIISFVSFDNSYQFLADGHLGGCSKDRDPATWTPGVWDRLIECLNVKSVIDIGCGTAVLAMAVAKASSAKIMASDVDPVAVEVALANLKANNLENRIDCIEAMGFEDFRIKSRGPYDLIFANILKRPLIDLAPDISGHMSSGGQAIISGILDEQADEIIDFYQQNGLVVFDRIDIGEWVTLTVASGK